VAAEWQRFVMLESVEDAKPVIHVVLNEHAECRYRQ